MQLIHMPVIALCAFIIISLYRFWKCIDLLGYTPEVSRRAPNLVQGDIAAAALAFMPLCIALVDWFRITLPGQSGPASSFVLGWLSVACLFGSIFMLRSADNRIVGHWAGTRESALRTVAALRIIDATYLAHALEIAQRYEAEGDQEAAGQVIDMETPWSKK